ncbi:MAG: DegT/DnrJ/EryC1/StrS family aminotransferase [Lachnospiraceae bacterium]|nr:DegT/DnrJ/EryC1/StrS family aminotransferase [Lachnospiraceae bacterium]
MKKKLEDPVAVTRSSLPPLEEYVEMLKPLWKSAWLTNMGDYHEQFKAQLKEYLMTPELELFVNGHMALELALQALELKGEVITTPFSFASTTHAIVRNGLKPVFCDINPVDYTLDAEQLESRITRHTTAIVPVHVYGNFCDVERIAAIAKRHKLKVIYDAAHAFGETLNGRGAAEFGDLSMFSFHATKVFHSIEGGAVAFREPWLRQRLYELKNFGITGYESVEYVGANGKMNEFQAAMGLCNLRHVESEIARRKKLAGRYRERLSGVKGIRLCPENPRVRMNYAYMPVVFDGYKRDRDWIFQELARYNIHARKYFYPCINHYACYQGQYDEKETPVAARISRQVLTLPLYADLAPEIVDMICDIILEG